MGWLKNVIYKNQEIENERLELTDKNSLYYLSTHLTLRNCTVVLKVPASRLIINQARFIDCTFEVKQELKNHQDWITASLKGCRFKGRLSGCDFGHWPEYGTEPEYQFGAIEDCDFSEARLDGCRFMGCDPSTLRFPRWPCFTILDPIGHSHQLNSIEWPGRFGLIVIEDLHTRPPSTRAITYHAPSIARRFETTPEALRSVVEKFDCIVY
ncbi:pentapeptide repeat-containing protein [Archangium gephyra]|nr:pentapeptide repeat-containing protein [Archangium gephyra]